MPEGFRNRHHWTMGRPDRRDTRLAAIVEKVAARPDTFDVGFALTQPREEWSWSWTESGAPESCFVSSVTKLFTTAIVMQMRKEGLLSLDDTVVSHLGADTMEGLHTLGGVDYTPDITIRHLLSHTSGLPDYWEQKPTDGPSLFEDVVVANSDRSWTFDEAMDIARRCTPRFPPGTPGKAFYSDTNFHLLGRLIELHDRRPYAGSVEARIVEPLGLRKTYVFSQETLDRFPTVARTGFRQSVVSLPNTLASFCPDGGIVSTPQEGVAFLEAFMSGVLFPREYLAEMTSEWRRIFYPLRYGMGIMRFSLSRMLAPFSRPMNFLGHAGSSGAALFYEPSKDLFVCVVVNQAAKPSLPFQVMSRLSHVVR